MDKIQSYLNTTAAKTVPLGHYTNPIQEAENPNSETFHSDDVKGFADHSKGFTNAHHNAIYDYKSTGTGEPEYINTPLRKNITPEEHINEAVKNNPEWAKYANNIAGNMRSNINNLDHVTSYKLKKPTTVYRDVHEKFNPNVKPGKTFVDNGFTSTTLDPKIAGTVNYENPNLKSKKPHIFRIYTPAGTKGYHLDQQLRHSPDNPIDEGEFLLHRGTKFKVRSHSQSPNYHMINLDVVGQRPSKAART